MEVDDEFRKIEETVTEILKDANLEEATEGKVRTMAAEKLGFDLSAMDRKRHVRRIVESFLLSLEVPNEFVEQQNPQGVRNPHVIKDLNDNRLMIKLSNKKNVAVHDFRGTTYISIRDYYEKDGKQLPSKGISLSIDHWLELRKNFPAIEDAIMKEKLRIKEVGKHVDADTPRLISTLTPPQELIHKEATMSAFDHPPGFVPIVRQQVSADVISIPQGRVQDDKAAQIIRPQGLVLIGTTRLDGKNYSSWARHMQFFLGQLKIAYVLTGPCPGNEAEAQKWADDNYMCCHHILNSLSDHLFEQYSYRRWSAKEMWGKLKLLYDDDFGTKMSSQVNKYIQFQMIDGGTPSSVLDQVQELNEIADSISASGMKVDENFHARVIVSKLPRSWKEIRMKLMNEEFLPLNVLMGRLRAEEDSRKREINTIDMRGGEMNNQDDSGKRCQSYRKIGHISRNGREMNKDGLGNNCGEMGHISRRGIVLPEDTNMHL